MFLRRTVGALRPLGAAGPARGVALMSTRPRVPPSLSMFQQGFGTNDNKSRSYSWLFQEPKVTTATIRLSENERGETVFEGSALGTSAVPPEVSSNKKDSTVLPNLSNKQASYDFLFTEARSPFGSETAINDVNRTKSTEFLFETESKEQENLRKVLHSLLEDGKAKKLAAEEPMTAEDAEHVERIVQAMNRNARAPKKANRGRRPCSHVARRSKRMKRHKGW